MNKSEKVHLLLKEGFLLEQVDNEEHEEGKPSQAKILIEIAIEKCSFFIGHDDKTYASIMINNHSENWEIKSTQE